MPLIKRYPNRKLYDTEAKQYITLDQIAEMIRHGKEIRVTDNASGEDLTALTLTQVIVELEKKQSGFLPRSLLSGLIQAGGDTLSALQHTLTATIGLGHPVDEEIKRRIHILIDTGQVDEVEGLTLLNKLTAPEMRAAEEPYGARSSRQMTPEEVERYLEERQVPTREDLQRLIDQIDALSATLDEKS